MQARPPTVRSATEQSNGDGRSVRHWAVPVCDVFRNYPVLATRRRALQHAFIADTQAIRKLRHTCNEPQLPNPATTPLPPPLSHTCIASRKHPHFSEKEGSMPPAWDVSIVRGLVDVSPMQDCSLDAARKTAFAPVTVRSSRGVPGTVLHCRPHVRASSYI